MFERDATGCERIGRQPDGFTRLPSAQQRGTELDAIVQIQREILPARALQKSTPGGHPGQKFIVKYGCALTPADHELSRARCHDLVQIDERIRHDAAV